MAIHLPARRARARRRQPLAAELQVTPLVDMFVIIVLFLITNFSATGEVICCSINIALPVARNLRDIESAPVVSITKTEVLMSGSLIGSIDDVNVPLLEEKLRDERKKFEDLHAGAFTGDVNIQADKSIDFGVLKRVMLACVSAGFSNMNFAAIN